VEKLLRVFDLDRGDGWRRMERDDDGGLVVE